MPTFLRSLLCLSLVMMLAPVAPAATSAPQSPDSAADRRLDAYIKEQMVKYRIPGLAVAVVREGKILKVAGYGLSSVELDIPVGPDTVFQLYSTSKIFAGLAVMKLIEDGRLSTDTPVTDLIAGLPPGWKEIRVRHLLTHTSGLQEWSSNPRSANLSEAERKKMTAEEALRLVAEMPLKFAPGEKFSYHRSGYNLLGMIVEKLARKSYAAFLQERVFAPLGMASTQFGDTEVPVKRRPPTAYNRETGELRNWVYLFGANGYPAAGLNSSAADLAKLLSALDAGSLLKRESLRAMWSPVRLNDGTEKGYGLGWTVGEHRGRRVVGHEGGGAAWIAHFPDQRLSVAVLCNLNGARADEIQYAVADLYLAE